MKKHLRICAGVAALGLLPFTPPACANPPSAPPAPPTAASTLFLKNCAHCHGADAHGDEGPDLHRLDWTDEQITTRIRNGKKGQMPAFAAKLTADQINQLKDYVQALK